MLASVAIEPTTQSERLLTSQTWRPKFGAQTVVLVTTQGNVDI